MSPSLLATLKTLHVIAAVLFVGNVIVTGVWAAIMFRARASHPFHVAARAIVITDWIFTLGGGALLVMTGVGLAMGRQFPIWGTPWIRHALIALMISTAAWLLVLVPAQRQMLRADHATLPRAFHRWNITGWCATAPLLYAIWCMVAKPGS